MSIYFSQIITVIGKPDNLGKFMPGYILDGNNRIDYIEIESGPGTKNTLQLSASRMSQGHPNLLFAVSVRCDTSWEEVNRYLIKNGEVIKKIPYNPDNGGDLSHTDWIRNLEWWDQKSLDSYCESTEIEKVLIPKYEENWDELIDD